MSHNWVPHKSPFLSSKHTGLPSVGGGDARNRLPRWWRTSLVPAETEFEARTARATRILSQRIKKRERKRLKQEVMT